MASKRKHKPQVRWAHQAAFTKMRRKWSRKRKIEDKKALRKLFNKAAASPLIAAELKWAKEHGIKFFIDRTAVNCGGYYTTGTGVVAIGAKYVGSDFGLEVLAHELRHAWQDYHGLIAWDSEKSKNADFTAFFINDAMIEADATAHQNLAKSQIRDAWLKKRGSPASRNREDENVTLRKGFLSWFDVSWPSQLLPRIYGDDMSKRYGAMLGVYDGKQKPRRFEFKIDEPNSPGFNIHDKQDVLRLGRHFSGAGNYLAGMKSDILQRRILNPSLARSFWGAANDNQKKLTSALHCAFLKATYAPERVNGKLKATRNVTRHPWP